MQPHIDTQSINSIHQLTFHNSCLIKTNRKRAIMVCRFRSRVNGDQGQEKPVQFLTSLAPLLDSLHVVLEAENFTKTVPQADLLLW